MRTDVDAALPFEHWLDPGERARLARIGRPEERQRTAIRLWPLPDGHWLAAAMEDGSAHDRAPMTTA